MNGTENWMIKSWDMAAQRADRVRFVRSGDIGFLSRKQAGRMMDDRDSLYRLRMNAGVSEYRFEGDDVKRDE